MPVNHIEAIRRLANLWPCLGRPGPVQSCPGQRPATSRRLFDFVWLGQPSPAQTCQGRPPPARHCPSQSPPTQSCPTRSLSANPGRLLSILRVFWDIMLVVNGLPAIEYLLGQPLSFWKSTLGLIKRIERVKQLSRPSHPPSFYVSRGANTLMKILFFRKKQNHCHFECHNHTYAFQWLLLTKNCRLGPRCTWYWHRTSDNCTGLLCCSLWVWVQELVQMAVNCLCISHLRYTQNVHICSMNVHNTSPAVFSCRWHLVREFW